MEVIHLENRLENLFLILAEVITTTAPKGILISLNSLARVAMKNIISLFFFLKGQGEDCSC